MKFVFTNTRLIMGGIETLMMRMSGWLIKQGHDVTIITSEGGSQLEKMPLGVDVVVVGSIKFNFACYPINSLFLYNKKLLDVFKNADVIMSFSDLACMFSYSMYRRTNSSAKLVAGVFHPAMCIEYGEYINNIFWQGIHDYNKLYMNQAIVDIHSEKARNTNGVKIWPLPVRINIECSKQKLVEKKGNIILSVGRLDRMKGYNIYMIKIIRDLIDCGFSDIEWHVIGDDETNGIEPTKSEMLKLIKEYNIGSHVRLHGTIDYNELPSFFSKAKVFVGMGTSLIEASASGVPAICAIVDEYESKTYGYLWDQAPGCVGERLVNAEPDRMVINLLKETLQASPKRYKEMSIKAQECTSVFDMELRMSDFVDYVTSCSSGIKGITKGRSGHVYGKSFRYIKKLFKKGEH